MSERVRVKVTGKGLSRLDRVGKEGDLCRVKYETGDKLTVSRALYETCRDRLTPLEPAELDHASSTDDELEELRSVAVALGVDVDSRWRQKRLLAEVEKAGDALRQRADAAGVDIDSSTMGPAAAREAVEQAERKAAENGTGDGNDE